MEIILQGLLELAGVSAGMVFDGAGRLVCHRAHAVYDRALCEEVSGTLIKALDSIALQQEDWESMTVQFVDGKLLVRSLGVGTAGAHYLAVVADQSLNASFATVAIRVATAKLKKLLAGGAASAGSVAGAGSSLAAAPRSSGVLPAASSSVPASGSKVPSNSNLTWSNASSSGVASGIAVADAAASTFLSRCNKELARFVGPMSKVYVGEAVRRVSPDAPFSLGARAKLIEDLAAQVKEKDRAQFVKVFEKDGR